MDKFLRTPAPGRIHKHHVGRRVPGGHLVHKPAGVIAVNPDISNLVHFRVQNRVPNRIPVQLHADHLLRQSGGGDADGADPAVRVDNRFLPRKPSRMKRRLIKHLCLHRIYLVKGTGRNSEPLSAKLINNKSGTV